MHNDLKVWVIPSFYVSEDYPLRGIFFKEQSEALATHYKDISIIYPEARSIKDLTLKKLVRYHFQYTDKLENGLRVFRKHRWNLLPTRFNLGLGQRLWIDEVITIAERLIKGGSRPDIIHAHCAIGAGVAAMILFQKYQIPYIITEHLTHYNNLNLKAHEVDTIKKVFEQSSSTVTVSTPFKDLVAKTIHLDPNDITVIPNFIDTDFFTPKDRLNNGTFVFTTICHLSPKKRVDRLLRSVSQLISKGRKCKLIIGGDGSEMPALKKLTLDLGIQKHVEFTGAVDRDQVKNLMQASDCFVLASDIETFGVVLIEAMACGIPIIATKSGGPEDIVTPECGILVEKDDNALAAALDRMTVDRSDFDGAKIRDHVMENFSAKRVSLKYVDLYERAFLSAHSTY